jgi:hypothetical protein
MTIAERKAREAYDRENPWRPMKDARPDGTLCELLFQDMVGSYDADDTQYFITASGDWYRLNPPTRVFNRTMNWRPARVKLTPERRAVVIRQAER